MTRKLLVLSGRRTDAKFMAYHDHNGARMRPRILAALAVAVLAAVALCNPAYWRK